MVARRFRTKEEGRKIITKYVKDSIRSGHYPSTNDITKRFRAYFYTYFKDTRELYGRTGILYHIAKRAKKMQKGKSITGRKRRFPLDVGRKKIIKYIKNEAKWGHLPGRHEIQENLGISLFSYFKDTGDAYKAANVNFEKGIKNPFLAIEKEKKLTDVSITLLNKIGFEVIEFYRRTGSDILVKDSEGNLIPVELKAYHRNVNIPLSNVFMAYENEIDQLQRYITKEKSPFGILITTTDRIRIDVPSNIRLINGKNLISLLKSHGLSEHVKTVHWIRNTYSRTDRKLHEQKIKKSIISYIRKQQKNGIHPSMRNIQLKFKINISTYFPSGLKEAYELSDILMPCKFLTKGEVRRVVGEYIKAKVSDGKYPALEDIEKKFGIRLRTYFRNKRGIYKSAGVKTPIKHLKRKEAIKVIISYVNECSKQGKTPKIRDINKELNINVCTYFKNPRELYSLAKIS